MAMEGRSALLTLWGKETYLGVVAGETYIVQYMVLSNDFNKQRCYSSTTIHYTTGVVSTGSKRKEVQLAMEGRSVLLTLWG